MPAIETRSLTRAFDSFLAVDDLTLAVPRGAFFGFLGPNGAGKSTTVRMLTGVLRPTSGRASVLGLDLEHDGVEAKRRMGVVPEEFALFDRLRGREHLVFIGRLYGLERAVAATRAEELLELLGLAGHAESLVADYSHGMKKKLALGCALIHGPDVLFLDEPFEGIDAVASATIRDLLQHLTTRGVTVFLTSHILEIVERLCDHLGIIVGGRLRHQGPMREVRDGEGLESLFVRLAGGRGPAPRLSWLQ
jgi:ABC-2 type transport system ATP-binding protein